MGSPDFIQFIPTTAGLIFRMRQRQIWKPNVLLWQYFYVFIVINKKIEMSHTKKYKEMFSFYLNYLITSVNPIKLNKSWEK